MVSDLGRSPDQVARVSAQVIEAALTSALAQPAAAPPVILLGLRLFRILAKTYHLHNG